jgi:hypothetical protein
MTGNAWIHPISKEVKPILPADSGMKLKRRLAIDRLAEALLRRHIQSDTLSPGYESRESR